MNVAEMIIEVRQSTQNIGTNVKRRLLDEEIVWLLNKNQERFIQSKVKPRKDGSGSFQVDQLDADAVRPIVATNTIIPVYKVDTDENVYEAQLPADYSYLVSDDSRTYNLCRNAAPDVTSTTENITMLKFGDTTKSNPKYYEEVVLEVYDTAIRLSDIVNFYGASYNGMSSKLEKYVVRDVMLWYMRNVLDLQVYWENYKSIYEPSTFIFPDGGEAAITIDDNVVYANYTTLSVTASSSSAGKWVPNRLSGSDKISTLLTTAFVKPSNKSPISELSKQSLQVYADESFIVTGVRIDYVRKARRIDLALAQNCELSEEFHQAICDLTVEYFKAMTADPNWEVKLKDNMTRSVTT